MANKKINLKEEIIKQLKENDENFFYLAPDVVGSINNANLDLKKDRFDIDFNTTDGRKMMLKVPAKSFHKWSDENKDSEIKDFLLKFIAVSKQVEGEQELDEIVDEYGDLIGDDDKPSNGNFVSVGKSKFDTAKTAKQTVAKSKRFYGDLGLGIVTWIFLLFFSLISQ